MFERTKPPGAATQIERKVTPAPASPWRAVSIVTAAECCAAARAMSLKRWLCAEAPRLPLPECNAATCNCRYKHFADRRSTERRRIDRTGFPPHHPGPEHRSRRRGRRTTD